MMAKAAKNGKPEAVAKATLKQADNGKFIVEILLATSVTEEHRMHLLMQRLMRQVGQVEFEVGTMDPTQVEVEFDKLPVPK